ncbi:MAG: glycosyltransferase family 4 protein [Gammaproteobacteria bacterium]|nr:glycosyltransferase family 4 protein [Gammaproteobacteria bacterium]
MKAAIALRSLLGMSGCPGLVLEQLRFLTARGVNCELFAERLDADAVIDAGAHPRRLRRLPGPRYWSRVGFATRVQRRVATPGHDLVIGHGDLLRQDCLFVHNPMELERELLDPPDAVRRNPVVRFHREMYRRDEFRLLIANSELVSRDLQQRHGVAADKIRVVYPGYDARRFNEAHRAEQRAAMRGELEIDEHLLLGFISSGNFPMRGADILVDCLGELPADVREELRVLVVGNNKNLDMMRRLFAARQIEPLMIGRGKIPDVQRYFHAIDLLCHPARLEPFGLVIVESIGCGTPVLTSRQSGAAELLPPAGVTDAPQASAFAEKLIHFVTDRTARQELITGQRAAAAGRTLAAWCDDWAACMRDFGLLPATD